MATMFSILNKLMILSDFILTCMLVLL